MSEEPDKPVPVELVGVDESLRATIGAQQDSVIAPTTTAEENRGTAGQRRVNLVWEYTQSLIAIFVTLATLGASVWLVARQGSDTNTAAFILLSNAFFLVVGFYFGRTNHQRVGGVQPPYQGR